MVIENWIERCDDGHERTRMMSVIDGIAMHRIGAACGKDAGEIADFLKATPGVMGMAYTFVITPDGTIQQAQPISDVTPHAKRWNLRYIGVAAIGDFRKDRPPSVQFGAAINLCTHLVHVLTSPIVERVRGHDELPDGSDDPDKECPGRHWDMREMRALIRRGIRRMNSRNAMAYLMSMGITV